MSPLPGRGLPRRLHPRLLALLCALVAALAVAMPAPAEARRGQLGGTMSHPLWFMYNSEAEMDRQLDHLKSLGVGITRVDVGWSSIEHERKGQYEKWYLDRLDHLVEGANARGIKLLLLFAETPCWASTAPESLKRGCEGEYWNRGVQNYPPKRASDYADALAWVVKRYGDKVYAWEIWNEPNLEHFFTTDNPVGDYAKMVRAAYPAAKAADPRPIIVAGSLSDSDFEFTDALYRKGVKGHFDAWSVHPYAQDRSPLYTDVESPRYSFAAGVPAVHRVMRRHGDDSPLWLTEFGWSTCDIRGQLHWQNCVSPSTQSKYLRQAFKKAESWSYVPAVIAFNLKDTTGEPDDRTGNHGLLRMDDSKKQSYFAFRDIMRDFHDGASKPPTDPPTVEKPRRRRGVVHAARRDGVVRITGRTSRRGLARLLVYRLDPNGEGFEPRPTYRWRFPAKRRGRFTLRLGGAALQRGTWLIVVRPSRRARWRMAATVLSG